MVFLPSKSVLFHMLSVGPLKDVPAQWFQNVVPDSAASVSWELVQNVNSWGPPPRQTESAICV